MQRDKTIWAHLFTKRDIGKARKIPRHSIQIHGISYLVFCTKLHHGKLLIIHGCVCITYIVSTELA